jgi:hypothetical protein
MKEVWDHHDHIVKNTPTRTHEWGIQAIRNEVDELSEIDPQTNPQEFLYEGADIVISYFTTMKSAGFSYEVVSQALIEKLNIVIDRFILAEKMPHENWEDRYLAAKEMQKEVIIYES